MPALKAIVTGHSRGLGAALAETLLERGIPVLACARRDNPDLAGRFADRLCEYRLDLGDAAALADWLDGEALRHFCADAHTLLLINNAGTLMPVGPLGTPTAYEIAAAVALNIAAPLMFANALTRLHTAGELRIMHISSGAARSAYVGWSVYGATKAALDHHARAVAAEQRPDVRICSLAPGVVDTEMQAAIRNTPEAHFPMRQKFRKLKEEGLLSSPRETAERIVAHLLAPAFGGNATLDLRDLRS